MAFTKDRTKKTLTWLDFYGLCREAGMSPFATQQYMDEGSDTVNGAMAEMAANAGAEDAESEAVTDAVGDAMMAIGAGIVAVAGESVIGAVVGIVIAAIGAIVKWFAKLFYVECDKYHCGGYDRNTKTRRRRYAQHQQALVGVNLTRASKSATDAESNCRCKLRSHECSFIRYMHDGLMVNGIDLDQTDAQPTTAGRVRGVNGYGRGYNEGCERYWRDHADYKPLKEDGNAISTGSRSDPWENSIDSYYGRSFRVHAVLWWMQEHILCRTMECMEDVLLNTTSVEGDSSGNQKRRRGSRWYASIVWMMNDVWETGKKLGWSEFERLSREVGANDTVIADLHKMRDGHVYPPEQMPFQWWPFLYHFSWWQLRDLLIKMKPLFPYEPPVGQAAPEGEEARVRTVTLAPMLIPIRTAVKFNRNMQPVPAHVGPRGPGLGTIAFGAGAAAIGAFAVYKLVTS